MGKTINQLIARNREIDDKLTGMQGRELNEAEKAEYQTLVREFESNKRSIEMIVLERENKEPQNKPSFREAVKEVVEAGQAREISLSILNSGDKNNIVSAGAQRTTIYDLLPLLEKGLIWGNVGLKVQTGVKGNLLWPYATSNVEVSERGEAQALSDTDINFDKVQAVAYESGIAIAVTNEAIDEAEFDLEGFVRTQIGLAVLRYLNKKTFSPANWSGLAGPYKNASAASLECSYKAIKAAKAALAAQGVDMSAFAYVCDNKTKALLETAPKANGQGGFICENGKIDGDHVFVTEYINTKADGSQDTGKYYLAFGCFNYLAANQHGEVRFTVDPITLAKKNETQFILHTRWSLTDLSLGKGFAFYNLAEPDGSVTVNPIQVKVVNTEDEPVITQAVEA